MGDHAGAGALSSISNAVGRHRTRRRSPVRAGGGGFLYLRDENAVVPVLGRESGLPPRGMPKNFMLAWLLVMLNHSDLHGYEIMKTLRCQHRSQFALSGAPSPRTRWLYFVMVGLAGVWPGAARLPNYRDRTLDARVMERGARTVSLAPRIVLRTL
uniref:Uncharacterized protein n=1 Tax=mine drainage metagenome TaxID=410659 RepID=E6PFA4_9ZZZZ